MIRHNTCHIALRIGQELQQLQQPRIAPWPVAENYHGLPERLSLLYEHVTSCPLQTSSRSGHYRYVDQYMIILLPLQVITFLVVWICTRIQRVLPSQYQLIWLVMIAGNFYSIFSYVSIQANMWSLVIFCLSHYYCCNNLLYHEPLLTIPRILLTLYIPFIWANLGERVSAKGISYTCPSRFPLVGRAAISHTHMARSLSTGVSTRGDWKQLLSPFRQIGPICYVPPGHGSGGDFVFD